MVEMKAFSEAKGTMTYHALARLETDQGTTASMLPKTCKRYSRKTQFCQVAEIFAPMPCNMPARPAAATSPMIFPSSLNE